MVLAYIPQSDQEDRHATRQAPDADPGEDPAVRACGEDTLQAFKASGARLAASEDARDRAVGALVSNIGLGAKPGQAVRVLATAMDKSPRDPWIAGEYSVIALTL